MSGSEILAAAFDEHRDRLVGVAHRILRSRPEAEDAVQEAWLRLSRSDAENVHNLGGWLTTVVARVALDTLRNRGVRNSYEREHGTQVTGVAATDPATDIELAGSVEAALAVVVERLRPAERLAFVLHDIFAVPFDEVGAILDRSPKAAKQLASRARAKVRGQAPTGPADGERQRAIVAAFLAAARDGDFEGLLELLDPDVVLEAGEVATRMGAPSLSRGAAAVATVFAGRALAARPATVDGGPGFAWSIHGKVRVAWNLYFDGGAIVHIDLVADPAVIETLMVDPLG